METMGHVRGKKTEKTAGLVGCSKRSRTDWLEGRGGEGWGANREVGRRA